MGRTDIQTNLYSTAVDLPEETRVQVIQALNQVLADTTDLRTQAKFAHWNVKGYDFYQFHRLFDEVAETIEGHVDRVAERITALGGQAMGTTRIAAETSRLPEPPANAVGEDEYVEWLTDHVAHHANGLRMFIERVQELGDEDTADLLSDISLDVDKLVYLLESHLQAEVKDQVPATAGRGSSIPVQSATPGRAKGGAESRTGGQQGARRTSVSSSAGRPSGAPEGLTQVMDAPQQVSPQSSVPQDAGQPISAPRDIPQSASQPAGRFEDVGRSAPAPQQGGGQQPRPRFDQPPSQQGPGAPQESGAPWSPPQQSAPPQEIGRQASGQPMQPPQEFERQAGAQQAGSQPLGGQQETGQPPQGIQQPPGGMGL